MDSKCIEALQKMKLPRR
ncbi:Protein of unknown function [Gryllus bimaculatus]|nr:Protein of unknown function [Gryllus bimaculatus]